VTDQKATTASSASLYKYVPMDGLRRLLDGSVRFTQPSAFNDPFELLPEIVMPIDEPRRDLPLQFDIGGPRRVPPVGDIDEIPDGYSSGDPTSRNIVHDLNKVIGILCLSKVSDSLTMWSHYAGQYSGAVVEFDAAHEFFANPIEVEYRATRPRKRLDYYHTDQPIPLAELCVKSSQWAYEEEVRVARRLVDCEMVGEDNRGFPVYVQKLPVEAIKTITLGERSSAPVMGEIYERIKDTSIGLALAAIDMTGYGIRREIMKYPVPHSKMGPWMTPRTARMFLGTNRDAWARAIIDAHPLSEIVNKDV
jgi:Protein of unknown function (DUF2971)